MSLEYTEDPRELDEILAEIHREFREGLPERLEEIRSALYALRDGYSHAAAELFYRSAHSLKGAAPSFAADELVDPASALAEVGRHWYEESAVNRVELEAALDDVDRLAVSIERFIGRAEGARGGTTG